MAISMYSQTVPVFTKMLTNAKHWLDKGVAWAEQRKFDPNNYVGMRLAPDMLHFAHQIRIAGDGAKGCVGRLAGVELPKYEDNEATIVELQARLDKTIAYVSGFTAAQIDGTEGKEIVLALRSGEVKTNGLDYVTYRVLPNFYFHMTTAYAILRHNGVDVGKQDFLPKP
jgi:hypothetical protein